MARRSSGLGRQRDYGGYSEQQIDAALLRTQRSDPLAIAIRLLTLGVVYWLLARAIRSGLSAALVVLPTLLELLLVFWGGQLLKRFVDCRAFRKSAGSLGLTVGWTLAIGVVVFVMLVWNSSGPAEWPQALATARDSALQHGLHWALLAMIGGISFGTVHDVRHWKQAGGVFVWTAITATGFRLGLLLLFGMFGGLLAAFFGEWLLSLLQAGGWRALLMARGWAWPLWLALLALDLGVVVVSVLMHRDLQAQARTAPTQRKRPRLPG